MKLSAVSDFKVLVVGDAIIDEYRYATPIGKSVKDNIISVRFDGMVEEFQGGVWAAANHIRDFCQQVHVLHGNRITRNVRYVEEVYNSKLFTVHSYLDRNEEQDGIDVSHYDVVIVTDFGHGTMTDDLIELVTREARFLAVNTQTNSTNFGFNLITRYPRADYVVLDELEARLAAHDRASDIEDVILKLQYPKIIVTQGANGATGFDGEFYRERAIARKVVDTIGAGDAFLAVSSPFAAAGASIKELVTIGNAAGAIKVGIVGHRKYVTKAEMEDYLGN